MGFVVGHLSHGSAEYLHNRLVGFSYCVTPKDTSITRYNATSHGILSSGDVIEAVDGPGAHEAHAELVCQVWQELAPVGIIESEYAMQAVDMLWRRRRLIRWESATIQASVVRRAAPKKERRQPSEKPLDPMVAHIIGIEGYTIEHQEPDPTCDTDSVAPECQSIGPIRDGLLDDLDLAKFIRYDSYLSNKLGEILRELKRLKAERIGGDNRTHPAPDPGAPATTSSSGEPPKPAAMGNTGTSLGSGKSSMRMSEYFDGPSARRSTSKQGKEPRSRALG